MELLKTQALVVHGIRWKDSSKIIHLFSRERGTIKVVVKGLYRAKSPFRGILENLNLIECVISVKEGRGLQNLNHADLLNPFSGIREDLNHTAAAFSMLELIKEFIHADENSAEIFDITTAVLSELNPCKSQHSLIYLYYFLLIISNYLGFGWQLDRCAQCGETVSTFPAKLDLNRGAVLCGNCIKPIHYHLPAIEKIHWRLLLRLNQMPPADIPALTAKFPDDFTYEALLQPLLSHITYHTDQPLQLKSLKMFMS